MLFSDRSKRKHPRLRIKSWARLREAIEKKNEYYENIEGVGMSKKTERSRKVSRAKKKGQVRRPREKLVPYAAESSKSSWRGRSWDLPESVRGARGGGNRSEAPGKKYRLTGTKI